ncbi:fungal-specific transcription factor domain-containing protein [Mycena rosella]|uniref:Fungal-specific transcription factor domain-containing protein n=1 Tax=Mycena rosella TaxID=1033263 RepID=A0AAD7CWE5_MYCRO|nr:fungal-specific transcription factor domain-containing protein [Mycena rosella]
MEPPTTGLLYFPIIDPEDSGTPAPGSKRRRLRGACDTCRQRKIRCDSAKMPGNVCSNCIAFNCQCTHQSYAKVDGNKRSPQSFASKSSEASPPSGSQLAQSFQVETTAGTSTKTLQDSDVYNEKTAQEHVETIILKSTAYIVTRDLRNVLLDVSRYARSLENELAKLKAQLSVSRGSSAPLESTPSPLNTNSSNADDVDVASAPDGIFVLCDGFQDLVLDIARNRYFGRSSGIYLIQTAQKMKQQHDGPDVQQPSPTRRPEFWYCPWEKPPSPPVPVFSFPPRDLIDSLVSIFFKRFNILVGILHEPTFKRSIATGFHLVHHPFGAVVLAVCALASRYSEDPRVVLEGTNSRLSSGWEWFRQVQHLQRDISVVPTLYDLQRIIISILYLQGTSIPGSCWTLVAVGIRYLQELGVHMRKPFDRTKLSVEEELFKRVFWMFICSDTLISAFLGRPRVTRDDDYDIDYPVECDDEYWEHPDPQKRFQQPEDKPSVYAYLVSYLKLMGILGMAQKTIYSVKRAQRGAGWIQAAVAELDSALNQWIDSIPDHLRWDPNREDEVFATQSACLFAAYYHVQIQIHRSFISSLASEAMLSSTFPSLAICANSARSCSHIMEAHAAKHGLVAHPQAVSALMDSAIVLLLNVWGARRTGVSADPRRAANDVQKCISVLKMYERRWQIAGRHCDALFTIGNQFINANASQVPAAATLKRGRNTILSLTPIDAPAPLEPRTIAGSHRVSVATEQQEKTHAHTHAVPDLYALPISTEELGDLPVYESFDRGIPLEHNNLGDVSFAFGYDQVSIGDSFTGLTGE